MRVTVIDLGIGNLMSIIRGLENFGAKVTVTSDPKIIITELCFWNNSRKPMQTI